MLKDTYRYHYTKNLKLALPILFSHLGHMVTGLADSLMLGRVGPVELGACSLGVNIHAIILVLGVGLSISITPQAALLAGKRDYHVLGTLLASGLWLYTGTAVLLFLVFSILAPLIGAMDQPDAVVELTIPYFRVLNLSLIPLMIFQTSKQFAEGLSLTRYAMYVSLGANILNVLFNYLLIFGNLGFPKMGVMGAGWATLSARIIMATAMFWYLFSPKFPKAFLASFRVKSFSFPAIKKLTTQGLPIGLQMVFESSAFSAATIMVGWIGANALAGHQIALSLAGTTYMMANGLGAAATVRVGNQLGLGNRGQMRKAGFTVYHIVIAFMAITGFTFYLLRDWLPGLFVDEPEVIAITSNILIITAFFQISDGIQVAGVSALRGMEDVKIPTLITFLAYWLVGLQVGYWLGVQGNMGVTGIWLGLLTGLTVAALLLTCRFHQKTKVNMA